VNYFMGQTSRDAVARTTTQGIALPNKPNEDIPTLPPDITDVGDDDLMNLFVAYTSWNDYTAVQVAFARVDERSAQRTLDMAEAKAVAVNWSGGRDDRVAITKAKVASDPVVEKAREELDEKHAYRTLVEAIATNVERDAALISRELTRRTSGSTPITRRSSRWSP